MQKKSKNAYSSPMVRRIAEDGLYSKIWLAVLAVASALFIIFFNSTAFKTLTVLICIALCITSLIVSKRSSWRRLVTPLTVVLALYIVYSLIGRTYALSGKFFLNEYSKYICSFAVYVFVALRVTREGSGARRVAAVLSGAAAIFAALSVETASTAFTSDMISSISGYSANDIGFESGTRMTGIFANANILASALAFGFLLALYLLHTAVNRSERILASVLLGVNSFGFVLAFSMGATAALAVACVVYLIFSGKAWLSNFIRMAEALAIAVAGSAVSFSSFGTGSPVPLVVLVVVPAALFFADTFIGIRIIDAIEKHRRAAFATVGGIIAVALVYLICALTMSGPYTFGDSISRSAYPDPGPNRLVSECEGKVTVTVRSQNASEIMMHTHTVLYTGSADEAEFVVPDDSKVVYFDFKGESGSRIISAQLDSGEKLHLKYTLLPGFIANRIQGLFANQNAIQRTVFFNDGLNLFSHSPIVGNGMGSFETAIFGVQSFYYETKYVHSNYVQVLLDGGIVGFALYMGVLVLAGVSLIRRRRLAAAMPARTGAIFPALCAAFAFLLVHSGAEVSMSTIVFLPFAFALFALISSLFASAEAEIEKSTESPAAKSVVPALILRFGSCALGGFFALLVILNIYAYERVSDGVASGDYNTFASSLDAAIAVDPFEGNDYRLSYVINAAQVPSANERFEINAQKYADQLSTVKSNSIAPTVIEFYLQRGQYVKAIDTARFALEYNRANTSTWDICLGLIYSYIYSNDPSSIYTSADGEAITRGIADIAEYLRETNSELMSPVSLSTENLTFLGRNASALCALENGGDVSDTVYRCYFDLSTAIDSTGDGLADLLTLSKGSVTDGGIALDEGGTLTLKLHIPQAANYSVYFSSAEPLEVSCGDTTLSVTESDGRWVTAISATAAGEYTFVFTAGSAQTLTDIEIYLG